MFLYISHLYQFFKKNNDQGSSFTMEEYVLTCIGLSYSAETADLETY